MAVAAVSTVDVVVMEEDKFEVEVDNIDVEIGRI